MKRILSLYISLICLISTCVKSQVYKEDVLTIAKAFNDAKGYSVQLNYKMYLDHDLSKPFQDASANILKSNDKIYVKQSLGSEMLENDQYQIMVDDKMKMMAVIKKKATATSSASARPDLYQTILGGIDSSSANYKTIKKLSVIGNKVTYELVFKPNDAIDKVIVVIDKKVKMFESVTFFYSSPRYFEQVDNKPHLVTLKVVYSNYTTSPVLNQNSFSESNYITLNKQGKMVAQKKYASYQFINPN